ncbi:hypothetical protein [Maridesulfovibrio salexigens]|uniref:Uncharacterized protein n=1 Tax=Maridesulfovibrio salexigens (strain ATCC 14822 / DSM 2638 / NCIMB 8403 / VKM B-1763) TaxID=526222 RepID=C6BYS7_MARSD|nr:hypothetical protein [Maridesulfovibrio salexigens]ACS80684.1 conserved hypothetical protein [Maridesulfovibrio salexigens DSM 2638]
MVSGNPYDLLADRLESISTQIREIEAEARKVLYENNDDAGYKELMRRKAMVLAGLYDEVEPLAESVKNEFKERLERFSLSASQSLEVGSVFFMSALLYPDDYKDGDPNDLELFVTKVRAVSGR